MNNNYSQNRISSESLSTQFTRHIELNGKYRGLVIDRNDEYGIGRVKVHIPELMPPKENDKSGKKNYTLDGIWVMPRRLILGQHLVPWYNEWIEIEFDDGDPQRGFYTWQIFHIDGPINQLRDIGGNHYNNPSSINSGPIGPVGSSSKQYSSNSDKRSDSSVSSYYYSNKVDPGKLTDKVEIELIADTYVSSKTPKVNHYDVALDNEMKSFRELRTGKYRTITMHDTMNYISIREPKGNAITMYSNDSEFINITTGNETLFLHKTKQQAGLSTGGMGFYLDNAKGYLYAGTDSLLEKKTVKLVKNDKYRRLDAWYPEAYEYWWINQGSMYDKSNGKFATDNNSNVSTIIRGSAEIKLLGNSGKVLINGK